MRSLPPHVFTCAAWLLLLACGKPPARPDHAQELGACQRISTSGDALGRCLTIKYRWGPADAGPAKAAWQRRLDSLAAGPTNDAPALTDVEIAAGVRRWVECVFRETNGNYEANLSAANYNCRDREPEVDALITYTRRMAADSSRLLFETYNARELRTQ